MGTMFRLDNMKDDELQMRKPVWSKTKGKKVVSSTKLCAVYTGCRRCNIRRNVRKFSKNILHYITGSGDLADRVFDMPELSDNIMVFLDKPGSLIIRRRLCDNVFTCCDSLKRYSLYRGYLDAVMGLECLHDSCGRISGFRTFFDNKPMALLYDILMLNLKEPNSTIHDMVADCRNRGMSEIQVRGSIRMNIEMAFITHSLPLARVRSETVFRGVVEGYFWDNPDSKSINSMYQVFNLKFQVRSELKARHLVMWGLCELPLVNASYVVLIRSNVGYFFTNIFTWLNQILGFFIYCLYGSVSFFHKLDEIMGEHFIVSTLLMLSMLLVGWSLLPIKWKMVSNKETRVVDAVAYESSDKGNFITLLDDKGNTSKARVLCDLDYDSNRARKIEMPEMTIAGSTLANCPGKPELGALLRRKIDNNLEFLAFFWRLNDILVCTRHTAVSLTGINAFACPVVANCGRAVMNLKNVYDLGSDFFDDDFNLVKDDTLDAFMREPVRNFWPTIKVVKARTTKRSCYSMEIMVHGFEDDGKGICLHRSVGKTVKSEHDLLRLDHFASTKPGYSGSPLFSGTNVIAMHTGSNKDRNTSLRIEAIMKYLPYENLPFTSSAPSSVTYLANYRRNGQEGSVEYRDEDAYHVTSRGYIVAMTDEDIDRYRHITAQFDSDEEDFVENDKRAVTGMSKRARNSKNYEYDDENASTEWGYAWVEKKAKTFCPPFPDTYEETTTLIDSHKELALELGYKEGTLGYPPMNSKVEKVSLENHVKHFVERVRVGKPPSDDVLAKAEALVIKSLQPLKFVPDEHYDSRDALSININSTNIKGSKSAGHPYADMGMVTNADVLEKMGEEGLIDTIIREWHEPFDIKMFNKGEPTPIDKIEECMNRVIAGFPLHKTCKHQVVFKNLLHKCTERWKETPIKFPYSPAHASDTNHMWNTFNRRRRDGRLKDTYGTDKRKWDWTMFHWIFNAVKRIVKSLVIPHPNWDDKRMAKYMSDIDSCFDEVYKNCVYRTSSGDRLRVFLEGIMKSGWYLTILVNSIAMLLLHAVCMVLVQFEDKYEDEDYNVGAGGDDVINNFPLEFPVDKYFEIMRSLGVDVKPYHRTSGMDGAEFFSTVFQLHSTGYVKTIPVRFTKHVDSLKLVKPEDFHQALFSHRTNYVFDSKKFNYFDKLLDDWRLLHPDLPMDGYYTQAQIRARVLGIECVC